MRGRSLDLRDFYCHAYNNYNHWQWNSYNKKYNNSGKAKKTPPETVGVPDHDAMVPLTGP